MTTIWHNPRCSKSRQTLALIEAKAPVEVRHYLQDTPSAEELKVALVALGLPAIDIIRTSEARFTELGLSADSGEDTLIAAMVDNPILIERPIVFAGKRAAIGRPPETVLDLF